MGFKFSCALLLTAALLAGCAAGEPSQQPDQSAPPPDQSAVITEPAADKPEVFVDDPASPYPMAAESWSVDMDGDGVEELVELRAEKAYNSSETEPNQWHEITEYGLHPYTLVVTKGESVYEISLGESSNDGKLLYPWYFSPEDSEYSGTCWTRDRAGNPVLALWFDTLSAGGAGNIDVYAVAFQDGAPVALPVPVYGILAILDEETMIAQLTVPETGYTDTLDLNQWLQAWNERNPDFAGGFLYREDGTLEWPVAPGNIDGFCDAEPAEEGITLWQYLWGSAHMDGMGSLVTTISWDNGEAIALDQHFEWE